jgi:hypothetical protein
MEAAGKRWIAYPSRTMQFTIWNLADLHLMNAACAVDQIHRDVQIIAEDPCAVWMGGGDYADFIGYRDKRFHPDAVSRDVTVQELGKLGRAGIRRARDIFLPIRDKCVGLLLGNHELKYQIATEQEDLHAWLCEELGVPNLHYSALFDMVFVRDHRVKAPKLLFESGPYGKRGYSVRAKRIFAHHGAGYAQTEAGKLKRLIQFMDRFDADLFFCGHVHDQTGKRRNKIGADAACNKLVAREQVGVISGSYLKTYAQGITTYGEQRGFTPTNLGAAWIRFEPDKNKVWAEI